MTVKELKVLLETADDENKAILVTVPFSCSVANHCKEHEVDLHIDVTYQEHRDAFFLLLMNQEQI